MSFLQWALPRLGLRWAGFRKVRRQVCKRLSRRLARLELADLAAYRDYLEARPEEWQELDRMCRITISRFYRDRGVFDRLADELLPAIAAQRGQERPLRAWSAGCAGGEEAYTLLLIWYLRLDAPGPIHVVATDIDPVQLQRARRACYPAGALKDLPGDLRQAGFDRHRDDEELCLHRRFCRDIEFRQHDIRCELPVADSARPFDVIFCRYLAFTYFDAATQRRVADRLVQALCPGGLLIVGSHESPPGTAGLRALDSGASLWRKEVRGS